MAAMFGACVPVRMLVLPTVPLSLLVSYGTLVASFGSADTMMVPPRLGMLALLVLLPAGAVRRQARRGQMFVSGLSVAPRKHELGGRQQMQLGCVWVSAPRLGPVARWTSRDACVFGAPGCATIL